MSFLNKKPKEQETSGSPNGLQFQSAVLDLDKLIPKPYAFTFQGKRFILKTLTLEEFIEFYQAYVNLLQVQQEATSSDPEIQLKAYSDLFCAICDDMNPTLVAMMSRKQAMELLAYVIKCVTGRMDAEIEKKNDPLSMNPNTQVSESQP